MVIFRRAHYFLPRKVSTDGAIKLVMMDADALTRPDRTVDMMLKIIYRLYDEEGGHDHGALGQTA